jgi:hypothetical protein
MIMVVSRGIDAMTSSPGSSVFESPASGSSVAERAALRQRHCGFGAPLLAVSDFGDGMGGKMQATASGPAGLRLKVAVE